MVKRYEHQEYQEYQEYPFNAPGRNVRVVNEEQNKQPGATPEERGVAWAKDDAHGEIKWQDPIAQEPRQVEDAARSGYPTPVARRIFEAYVPEWRDLFLEKNAAYGEDPAPLGPGAEFVEIWRKAKKLRRALWDGEEIGAESPREVALDIIGHCFLLIDLLDGGDNIEVQMDLEESRDRGK